MRHRIRAAALIVNDNKILLVKHVHPQTGEAWWVPPGGGMEACDRSVFDCAAREVFEETGLQVKLSRIVYLREFAERDAGVHHMELFLAADSFSGQVTMANIKACDYDAAYIKEVAWLSPAEMQDLSVYPENLKDSFWQDLQQDFPTVRYLGIQEGNL
jgi:8-oxo-dGTP diphosphatase